MPKLSFSGDRMLMLPRVSLIFESFNMPTLIRIPEAAFAILQGWRGQAAIVKLFREMAVEHWRQSFCSTFCACHSHALRDYATFGSVEMLMIERTLRVSLTAWFKQQDCQHISRAAEEISARRQDPSPEVYKNGNWSAQQGLFIIVSSPHSSASTAIICLASSRSGKSNSTQLQYYIVEA